MSEDRCTIRQFSDPPVWGIFRGTQKLHHGSFPTAMIAVGYAEKKNWAHTVDPTPPRRRPVTSHFEDVGAFHAKFGLPTVHTTAPNCLETDTLIFRLGFLVEELAEFAEATGMITVAGHLRVIIADLKIGHYRRSDLEPDHLVKAVDALGDLNYVSLGTAHLMGLPFDLVWTEIQRANMAKERATGSDDPRSKRRHSLDVVKPVGWEPPRHETAIAAAFAAAQMRKTQGD